MKKKLNKKLPKAKKEIKDFLISEEGKITKKDIVKMGLSLAALGIMFNPSDANAQAHANSYISNGTGGHSSHSSHSSHASHASHGSHGSHCSGIHASGW